MSVARSLATLSILLALAAAASCADSSPAGATAAQDDDAAPGGDDGGVFGTHDCDGGSDFTGCPCQLGETRHCYTGPAVTRDVGTCKDGNQTCKLEGEVSPVFGPCTGEVLPGPAQCDGLDHACNGKPNAGCDGGVAHEGGQPPVDGGNCVASIAPPRLVAPLSTAHATSDVPTLHWQLAAQTDGARVQVCKDNACNQLLATFDAMGTKGAPPAALPSGPVFWRAFGMDQGSVGCSATAVWEAFVTPHSTPVDTSWGSVLDVNEDGYADAIASGTGAFWYNQPANTAGTEQMTVYMGSAGGLASSPALTLTGPNRGFGVVVADAGDVNGDGYADVVVATWETQTHLFLGGPSGLASSPAVSLPYGGQAGAAGAGGAGGILLTGIGDTNGDGYADVALGVPEHDEVYVFLGSASGLSASPSVTLTGGGAGLVAGSNFGTNVATAGDVNGDGYADLLVGAEPSGNPSSLELRRAYVYAGGPNGLQNSPSYTPTVPQGPTSWASAACAGDVNGDGYTDVLVNGVPLNAASGFDAAVFVFEGGSNGTAAAAASALTLNANMATWYGWDSSAGDFNGDGYWDVVASAPWTGVVYVYPGGPSGSSTTPAPAISVSMGFGYGVSGGDTNGDGFDDLGVVDGTNLKLYPGSLSGVSTSPSVTATTGQPYAAWHVALSSR